MADSFVMVRVEAEKLDVAQITQKLRLGGTDARGAVIELRNLLDAMLAGALDGQVVIATRDTTQAIAANGTGSGSQTADLK